MTGTEVGDEESYYEVEVTMDDGSRVDVQLDESFAVVSGTADVERSREGRRLNQRSAAATLPRTGRPSSSSIWARW